MQEVTKDTTALDAARILNNEREEERRLSKTADRCHVCGNLPGYQDVIRDCDECERFSCSDCVEMDVDEVGDPPQQVICQWLCRICLRSTE